MNNLFIKSDFGIWKVCRVVLLTALSFSPCPTHHLQQQKHEWRPKVSIFLCEKSEPTYSDIFYNDDNDNNDNIITGNPYRFSTHVSESESKHNEYEGALDSIRVSGERTVRDVAQPPVRNWTYRGVAMDKQVLL